MYFDIKDYTATKCFTFYSENYYKCPIKADEETKEGIWKAREDWNEQGAPARKRLDVFFMEALHQNQMYFDTCQRYIDENPDRHTHGMPPLQENVKHRHIGKTVCGIYSRATDEFVGWDMAKVVYREYQNLYMAVLPDKRNLGVAREIEIAGGKYIFTVRDFELSRTKIPVSETNENRILEVGVGFTAIEDESLDRGYPVQYGEVLITRDSFTHWLESSSEKNHYFDYVDHWS